MVQHILPKAMYILIIEDLIYLDCPMMESEFNRSTEHIAVGVTEHRVTIKQLPHNGALFIVLKNLKINICCAENTTSN